MLPAPQFATTDLCDDHGLLLEDGRLSVLPPVFRHFGQRTRFSGRVTTLKVFEDNGWAGIVVDRCVRDSDEINACDIGVRALAAHPKKSSKRNVGERNVRVLS